MSNLAKKAALSFYLNFGLFYNEINTKSSCHFHFNSPSNYITLVGKVERMVQKMIYSNCKLVKIGILISKHESEHKKKRGYSKYKPEMLLTK